MSCHTVREGIDERCLASLALGPEMACMSRAGAGAAGPRVTRLLIHSAPRHARALHKRVPDSGLQHARVHAGASSERRLGCAGRGPRGRRGLGDDPPLRAPHLAYVLD